VLLGRLRDTQHGHLPASSDRLGTWPQTLNVMSLGIDAKRVSFRRRFPNLNESEIERLVVMWLVSSMRELGPAALVARTERESGPEVSSQIRGGRTRDTARKARQV
jgi:hypothetical protein